ncbi:MAG: metallophosphoesterase family protein [Thermoleophilia bacterium]|nr:metallophosphoesterase family protein [Thermoleophilia bacterium]
MATAPAVTVAVISDTHMPGRGRTLPEACLARLRAADLIIHAGDWSDMGAVGLVRGIGPPVAGVHGNVEEPSVRAAMPATAEVDAGGIRIGIVHDAGPEPGRLERLRRRFPGCAGVVFGHSHIPLHEVAADGFWILNPGSPTDRRRAPRHSMAEIIVSPAGAASVAFWAVDDPAGPLGAELVRGSRH